jgi:uncharacterized protein
MRYRGDMETTTRPLSNAEIVAAKTLLHEAAFAYLAMIEPGGTDPGGPYLVPLNFVYLAEDSAGLGGRIYFHTGEGRKTDALAADSRVCMAVTASVVFDQGDSPCAHGFSYRSLLVWGRAHKIKDVSSREEALRAIVAKYDPSAAEAPLGEADFARTLLYEVVPETASYKERPPRSAG